MSDSKSIDPNEPIALVGIGSVFPGAANTARFWENIVNKVDSIIEVPKDRWDWKLYWSADRKAEDKTYSKIGGFVTDFIFEPLKLRIPPPVAKQMDTVQQLAVTATAEALKDAGCDGKDYDHSRTAVIFGNAMGGPKKEASDLRVYTALYLDELRKGKSFQKLTPAQREAVAVEVEGAVKGGLMGINEDTMPGELSNVIAGRVANTFNLNGANFTVDAACAASLGAIAQAVNGLRFRQYDLVVTGGVDQMMAAPAYVKFSKIGALSADGSRPFDAKADGFVMGEGCGIIVMKRLSDAVRDGDKIYCLLRAIGASSDGRGKGITAPNPKGQKLAIERTFAELNYGPADVGMLEAHGTSTKVGDAVEVQCAAELFGAARAKSIALGSVKSQIGHLKAAAGAAGLIKAALALHHKTLPPSINFEDPNPTVDWESIPFFVNTEARPWGGDRIRRANVSAFGFGGTNFHVALEEFSEKTKSWTPALTQASQSLLAQAAAPHLPENLGAEAFAFSGPDETSVLNRARDFAGKAPKSGPLTAAAAAQNDASHGEYRLTIAAESAEKLAQKIEFALQKAGAGAWETPPIPFKPKSIHLGRKRSKNPKVAFVFPGQGSQYVDMLKDLRSKYKAVEETFAEADAIMTKIIGSGLSDILFTKGGESPERLKEMQERIKQTEITQPAVLTADVAILRLLRQYGLEPDVVAGHSLGEYGALVAADVLSFEDALLAVSARGKEMAEVDVPDNGKMASIAGPVERVQPILDQIDGYVIAANKNCPIQTVIAGASAAVDEAVKRFQAEGIQAVPIEVSHAFHSEIIAPGAVPYGKFLKRISPKTPKIPVSSNVTGEYYPSDPEAVRELMVRQISSSVEWIKQVERMYADGVRLFLECGPKRALTAFISATLEKKKDVVVCSSNHPKKGGVHEFNDMLAKLTAAGIDVDYSVSKVDSPNCVYTEGYKAWLREGEKPTSQPAAAPANTAPVPADWAALLEQWDLYLGPVVVSGLGAGAPGSWDRVFRENAMDDIIDGKNLIEPVSAQTRQRIVEKNLEKVNKSESGAHTITRLASIEEVLRLAGQAGAFDMSAEFGVRGSISSLMDVTAKMGLAASILALKDAGIPLVRHYKMATTGKMIPTTWGLPAPLQEETGVIMASAFPGLDSLIEDLSTFFAAKYAAQPEGEVWKIYDKLIGTLAHEEDRKTVANWYADYKSKHPAAGSPEDAYKFSRSFLFRILSLGHAQTAQFLGAMGPCTQVNAACASTTQAVGIAEDWIRTGRCKRVIVMSADDITNPTLMPWLGTGFLSSGAASTHNVVSEAALPFDRRRNGMIIGMGASALVLECGDASAERGVTPLAQLLAAQFDNSAYHVTRLNTKHVSATMEKLLHKAEKRYGLARAAVADKTLFMSHETYTPAQGGSSAAEVEALKASFGADADKVIVTNTKGFTGHSMGASLEDVIAIRAMNLGKLPPIANYKEADPELSGITLSQGGEYDCEYALRLGAGFGSQIAMTFMRRLWHVSRPRIPDQSRYDGWLAAVSGIDAPEIEIVKNTLRVKDAGPGRAAAPKRATPAVPAPVPATAVATATKPAAIPAAKPHRDEAAVQKEIIALVSEKVGYPAEMLELDLDMEADLGIDTVKQAELIGILRDKYAIPAAENLSLKDYPTLRHVIGFVMAGGAATEPSGEEVPLPDAVGRRPPTAETTEAPAAAQPSAPATTGGASNLDEAAVQKEIVALVSEKVGYPAEMLELDLDMEADLGIDTVKQAELIGIIRDKYSIPASENLSLKDYPTLRHVIGFVMAGGGTPAAQAPAAKAPPVPAVATPPAPVAVKSTSSRDEAETTKEILALVSEKVGYPEDMLELDLDMEADLGIDTVKQAELIGILRDKYSIPASENLSLKDYPTLRHVVGFVMAAPPAVEGAPEEAARPQAAAEAPRFGTWDLQAYERPADGAARSLNAETPVVVLAADAQAAAPFAAALDAAGGSAVVVKAAEWESVEKAESAIRRALRGKTAGALLDITTVDADGAEYDKWTAKGFDKAFRLTARAAFLAAKVLQKDLAAAGENAWIAALTRMGGRHAVGAKKINPIGGAATGLVKALGREFDRAAVRALDFDAAANPEFMIETLRLELGSEDPRAEVGYQDGRRFALRLVPSQREAVDFVKFSGKFVTLVTGGGQGLGAELAKKIAKDHKAPLILFGRTPLAKEATAWARMSADELAAMKAEMWAKLKAEAKKDKKKKATPAALEKQFAKITKAVALQKNIEEMVLHGSKVLYLAVDMSDGPAVTKAVKQALSKFQTIDVVFHAAGLEESKMLADKKLENFDRVFRAKANGAVHLIKALPPRRGRRWAFFSSVVGRFGNLGQTDYAACSDFLSKLAARLNADGASAVTFDLTAFADIGMATRGGIEQFLKAQGVDFMPPATGIELMFEAMKNNTSTHEVLVAGALGKLDADGIIETKGAAGPAGITTAGRAEPTRGARAAGKGAAPPLRLGALPEGKPLFDELISDNGSGHVTGKEFSLESDPWLLDHAVGGTPWVAGVMGLELFAETAANLLGEVPAAFADVKFQLPIKLLRNKPIKVRAIAKKEGDTTQLRIESDFISPQGIKLGTPRTHFTGHVLSDPSAGWDGGPQAAPAGTDFVVKAEAIYDAYFHGPRFQVLEGIRAIAKEGLTAVYRRQPALWDKNERTLAFQPMLIEAAFQACGYRDLHFGKKMTLPDSIGKVRVFKTETPPESLEVRVRYKGSEGDKSVYDASVVDAAGNIWIALEDYRMIRVS